MLSWGYLPSFGPGVSPAGDNRAAARANQFSWHGETVWRNTPSRTKRTANAAQIGDVERLGAGTGFEPVTFRL